MGGAKLTGTNGVKAVNLIIQSSDMLILYYHTNTLLLFDCCSHSLHYECTMVSSWFTLALPL